MIGYLFVSGRRSALPQLSLPPVSLQCLPVFLLRPRGVRALCRALLEQHLQPVLPQHHQVARTQMKSAFLPCFPMQRPLLSQDQIVASREIRSCRLVDEHMYTGGAGMVRSLTPSRTTERKLPRCVVRNRIAGIEDVDDKALKLQHVSPAPLDMPLLSSPMASSRQVDWERQDEWHTRMQKRFTPYMKVKTSYVRPDGTKAEAIGTLLKGWGTKNKFAKIPYSHRSKAKDNEEPSSSDDESQDTVVVQIHGVERYVPRDWVTPLRR